MNRRLNFGRIILKPENPDKLIMQCTICKTGKMKSGQVTVTLEREGSIIIIKGVPAMVCENCGEYTLNEMVTKYVMEKSECAVANRAEIEILQYAA